MIKVMTKKVNWKKIIEDATQTNDLIYLDPTSMSHEERHDLIEGLYLDYMYFLAQKKPPLKILKNYKSWVLNLPEVF